MYRDMEDPAIQGVFRFIAEIIGCNFHEVNMDMGWKKHPLWDSLGQLEIMLALEKEKGIEITDENISKYCNMPNIISLFLDNQESNKTDD